MALHALQLTEAEVAQFEEQGFLRLVSAPPPPALLLAFARAFRRNQEVHCWQNPQGQVVPPEVIAGMRVQKSTGR